MRSQEPSALTWVSVKCEELSRKALLALSSGHSVNGTRFAGVLRKHCCRVREKMDPILALRLNVAVQSAELLRLITSRLGNAAALVAVLHATDRCYYFLGIEIGTGVTPTSPIRGFARCKTRITNTRRNNCVRKSGKPGPQKGSFGFSRSDSCLCGIRSTGLSGSFMADYRLELAGVSFHFIVDQHNRG